MREIREFIKVDTDSWLAELDYSQLEVCILAALSEDLLLMEELKAGVDMHCVSASLMYGAAYPHIKAAVATGDPEWIEKRKKAKAVSFLVQYGGGAKAAAKTAGVALEEAEEYIRNYRKKYVGVHRLHEKILNSAESTRKVAAGLTTTAGNPVGIGVWQGPTGRTFSFRETDSPSWMTKPTSFSPTQIKNYPIQGTAADVVNAGLVYLENALYHAGMDRCWFINQVHDSYLYQVRDEDLSEFVELAKYNLQRVQEFVKATYGWDMPDVPFRVEAKIGKNWNEMRTV